jgi:hypothetical protein
MSKRKETPDILAEILGGDEPPVEALPVPAQHAVRPPAEKTIRKAESAPGQTRRTSTVPVKPAKQELEYLLVSFQYYHGWRPRFHNGRELDDWLRGPAIHEHIGQLAAQGWELVTAGSGERMYGAADSYQLYFRRPKS